MKFPIKRFVAAVLVVASIFTLSGGYALAATDTNYGLYVDGVKVTDSNAASLSDGKASYDASTNTLYLKGGMFNNSVKSSESNGGYPCILYYTGTETLTVSVSGNNTVSTLTNNGQWNGADGAYAIWSAAPLTINGTGYLDARGGTGIYVNGGVTIGSNVHIAAESKVNTRAIVATSYNYPYAEYDKEDGEYDFNLWRTDESVVEFESWAKSVTMGKFFEMLGEFHSFKRTDNQDGATHKFGCSCGVVYVASEKHNSTGTTCGCGLPMAEVTIDFGDPKSYLSLADALDVAAAGGDAVIEMGAMTLTEDATLCSGDELYMGTTRYATNRNLTIADGVTLTLEAGSKIHLQENKVILEGTGRIVDNGAEIWCFQNYDRQHTHSANTYNYAPAEDGQHTKTTVCKNCPLYMTYSTTLEEHTYDSDGLCVCGEMIEVSQIIPGDLNGDGLVDVKDVSMVIRYYRRLDDLTEDQLAAAEVTGDGIVDVKDVSKMIRYYRRLIDSLA